MALTRRRRQFATVLIALGATLIGSIVEWRLVRSAAASQPVRVPHDGIITSSGDQQAPERFEVHLETNKGVMAIEVRREWAPHGADRFYTLVEAGYYNDTRFFRVVAERWAQFGINGTPAVSQAWRNRTIPDDPRVLSNVKGTVAFAFAVPNGRTTQVFINLQDNSPGHDTEPFAPFGRITRGIEVIDQLNSEYGDTAGGGIRAGKQAPLFERGNAYLDEHFPRLDRIVRATVVQ